MFFPYPLVSHKVLGWAPCYLLCIYTATLIANVQKNFPEISCYCYADDTQLYVSFRPDAQEQSISNLEACVDYIRGWMLQNRLMLNDSKTELMIIGTPKQTSKLNLNGITVGNSVIKPSVNTRNLGVQLDTHLNMEYHITNTCKSAYHMINLRRIRQFLDKDSRLKQLFMHASLVS